MPVHCHAQASGAIPYCPHRAQVFNQPANQLFRSRQASAGRIRIRSLNKSRPELNSDLDITKTASVLYPLLSRRLSVRLAGSRESAKRFLRSVIAQNSNEGPQQGKSDTRKRSSSRIRGARGSEGEVVGAMRSTARAPISGPTNATLQRPRLAHDTRNSNPSHFSNTTTSSNHSASPQLHAIGNDVLPNMNLEDEKPVAAGNGVTVGIHLAEPALFLQGFDNSDATPGNTAMLRGSLHVRVQKSAKIKAISLKFKGRAITRWPEGIPPRKTEFEEINTIMNHTWPFFNAQFEAAEKGTGADQVQLFKGTEAASTTTVTRLDGIGRSSPNPSALNLTAKEAKRLSLSANRSRSFPKDNPPSGPSVSAKGYRTFLPGDYIYNFELPIDSRLPESIDVELGNVKYELEATVERSGAFRANLLGSKEVVLIRAPAEGSLEQVEPIAISRNWEDQLHYDIVISGKSFPLGSQVPIAFKLTPLAKVQCHRIKVLVTENVEYFCANKHVHRMEPPRKVQLFEKRSDSDPTSAYPGSTMRITAGGGIPYDARVRAARGESVVPADSANLLGSLDADSSVGPTEMEFNVQLPNCHAMRERDRFQRLHFDTTYTNIRVHHWIKIVMRLSKPDVDDPSKRRHFEISIDSPFHILSCRATQANISLPAYTSPSQNNDNSHLFECGCPGAARRRNSPLSYVPTLSSLSNGREDGSRPSTPTNFSSQGTGLARPPAAHIGGPASHHALERPIHLLRAPSYNPPAFEDEEPPPQLITPPPQYDTIASPTSGLADYFSRLSDTYDEDDDNETDGAHRDGRVNVPLTPGARVNRSMDIGRNWIAAAR